MEKKTSFAKTVNNKYYNFATHNKFLICCDLDGTLLDCSENVSQKTIDGIKKISKAGHVFCLVTGRPYNGSIHIYEKLKLDTIMVNQNGSFISNPSKKNFVSIALGFNYRIFKQIFTNAIISPYINNAVIEGLDKCWIWREPNDKLTIELMKGMFHINNRPIRIIHGDLKAVDTDISSILIHVADLNSLNIFVYEIKNIAPTLTVRTWQLANNNGVIIEINSQFASKMTALRYLSSYYGIPSEQCVAFGDGDNDVEMLQYATWGFAMKNASPAPILASRYITKNTNDEDGVIRELLRFLRLKKDI